MDRETAKAINNISNKLNEVERKLDMFFNQKCDTNAENIEINTDTIATVMEVVLPTQSDTLDGVADTLDTLMTDIIPSLMGSE